VEAAEFQQEIDTVIICFKKLDKKIHSNTKSVERELCSNLRSYIAAACLKRKK